MTYHYSFNTEQGFLNIVQKTQKYDLIQSFVSHFQGEDKGWGTALLPDMD